MALLEMRINFINAPQFATSSMEDETERNEKGQGLDTAL